MAKQNIYYRSVLSGKIKEFLWILTLLFLKDSEEWTLSKEDDQIIKAIEILFFRRLLSKGLIREPIKV